MRKKISSVLVNVSESEVDEVQSGYTCDSIELLDSSGVVVQNFKHLIGDTPYRSKHELILNVAYEVGVDAGAVSIVN